MKACVSYVFHRALSGLSRCCEPSYIIISEHFSLARSTPQHTHNSQASLFAEKSIVVLAYLAPRATPLQTTKAVRSTVVNPSYSRRRSFTLVIGAICRVLRLYARRGICGIKAPAASPLPAPRASASSSVIWHDERTQHLEFGWSRPHGVNCRCHPPRPRIRGAIPRADFKFTYEQSGQPRSDGFEKVRAFLVDASIHGGLHFS